MTTVLGAGIIGLYTALLLTDIGVVPTIVAQHVPGDQSAHYASPWAGGNFSAISSEEEKALRHDRESYDMIARLKARFGSAIGITQLESREMWADRTQVPQTKIASLRQYVFGFRELEPQELPEKTEYGFRFETFNFHVPKMLGFLKTHLETKGVRFVRKTLGSIDEAFEDGCTLVFNCTGLGARTLVNDPAVHPIRGQVVVARTKDRKPIRVNMGHHGPTLAYMIPRFDEDNVDNCFVVLGGTYEVGEGAADTFAFKTEVILEGITRYAGINAAGLEIVKEYAGLRPGRRGGVRIERETRERGTVVHNYGAGGTGYQSGLAMAAEAIELVKELI